MIIRTITFPTTVSVVKLSSSNSIPRTVEVRDRIDQGSPKSQVCLSLVRRLPGRDNDRRNFEFLLKEQIVEKGDHSQIAVIVDQDLVPTILFVIFQLSQILVL